MPTTELVQAFLVGRDAYLTVPLAYQGFLDQDTSQFRCQFAALNSQVWTDWLTVSATGQVTIPSLTTGSLTLTTPLGVTSGGTGTATAFTAGSIVFAGPAGVYAQDNTNLFYDDVNNRVGLGTAAPAALLELVETSTASIRGLVATQVNTGFNGSSIRFRKARGAPGALTTVATADELASFSAYGYDGTNYLAAAAMIVTVTGTVTATRVAADIDFYTATDAAPSVLTKRLTIANTGNVGIASLGTANLLNVGGTQAGNASFEVSVGGSVVFQSFNRFLSVYTGMNVDGLAINIRPSGTTAIGVQAGGLVAFGTHAATAVLHIKAGTATANTAPLKLTSGALLGTAEAGAVEFLTDAFYGTITTGAARKTFAFLESPAFTGTATFAGPLTLKGYTVATLPAGVVGQCAYCTDLLAPGFLVAAVGGGGVVGPVFFNGTSWVAF